MPESTHDEINKKLDHIHEMLHSQRESLRFLTYVLADMARHQCRDDMTSDEVKAVTERLRGHAAKLEEIATAPG